MRLTELISSWNWGAEASPRPPVERRRSVRAAAQEPGVVHWVSGDGTSRAANIRLVNVSDHGIAFGSAESLEPGQEVTVETSGRKLTCVIRHSRSIGHRYYMGAEVTETAIGSDMLREVQKIAGKSDEL